ncbi:MAG: hypothetical protein QM775_26255 [Pirellulales bacterium]
MTHGGNGYVYRPVYGDQPFYNWQHFGSYGVVTTRQLFHGSSGSALVVDNPGTPYQRRYTPSTGQGRGHAALIDVMPHQYYTNPYGPGAEYAAAYYADPGFVSYDAPAAYVGPSVDAAPPVDVLPEPKKAPPVKKPPKAEPPKIEKKPAPKKLESSSAPVKKPAAVKKPGEMKQPAKPKASEF